MPKVKVGDINMYYELHGEGEPLVMICGGGGSTQDYHSLIPLYSREYRLVLFDNRGSGQSDAPDIPYTMEMLADDLAGLLDAIGVKAAHVSGISFGGGIAQYFALRYPERVLSLILRSTSCDPPRPSAEAAQALAEMTKLPPLERAKAMMGRLVTSQYAERNPDIVQRMAERIIEHPAPPHGVMRQRQAEGEPICQRLAEIKAPTLVIHGDSDQLIPVENARILASRIPNSELVIFENTGHILLEAENELNRITLEFLRRHSPKSP